MKILMTTLNSKFIHSNLALRYLYESAGIYRDLLEIKEFTINNDDMSIYMEIMRGDYDVICFSCYIWNISRTVELIKDIKNSSSRIRIIVGGPEVSYNTEEFVQSCPEADLIMIGEGDKTFPQLVKGLADGSWDFSKRIIWGELPVAEEIPFPYEHVPLDENRIIYYESARGCPYGCSFCLSSESCGVRYLPVERVKQELKFFLDRNVRQVKFIDRTFNANVKRAAEIMNYIISSDNGVTNFHFELCGDIVSEEMIDAFERARPGLFQVEIGVQSTCTQALEACGRRVDFEKLSKNVRAINACSGVHMHLDLIAGLPYESYERFAVSFDQVYRLDPDDLQLGFLKLIKGTRIRREAGVYGYVFREREPYEVIKNDYISAAELIKLKMMETVLELYHNKPGFAAVLKYIMDEYEESPFDFYRSLSDYYYANNYHLYSQRREELYRIIGDFIQKKGYEDKEGLNELLIYDKIAVAQASRYADRKWAEPVHSWLRDNCSGELSVKELIKQINYMSFKYNVDEYANGLTDLRRGKSERLLIFFPETKNTAGQARCVNVSADR